MKTKILISLALFAILIISCNKIRYWYYELTEVDKQIIPYELGQTVSFIDSEGYPFILTVQQDTTYLIADRLSGSNIYKMIGRRVVKLQSESLIISLAVEGYSPDDRYNTIDVFISIVELGTSLYYGIRYDKKGEFLGSGIHNSMDINGKVYYDVVECNTSKDVNGQPTIPTQLFYNKTYGILQINRDGENFLTINE